MNKNLSVSILIVNWNGEDVLTECLNSLLSLRYKPLEIIVVDNASSDSSLELLKNAFGEKVKVISLKENVGFASGINLGFGLAKGDIVATLNNDMVVEPTWLDQPISILKSNQDVGLISCKQINYFDRTLIDGLYHVITKDLLFTHFGGGKMLSEIHDHDKQGYVISANGGSAIIRKELFIELGGYDPNFFGYLEETDFCMRAFVRGWKCVYSPDAVVYHKDGHSFKKKGARRFYYIERNRIWFLYKNYPMGLILKRLFYIGIMELKVIKTFFFSLSKPSLYFKTRIDALKRLKEYKTVRNKNVLLFKNRRDKFFEFEKMKIISFTNAEPSEKEHLSN